MSIDHQLTRVQDERGGRLHADGPEGERVGVVEEFDARMGQRVYVSATPSAWELQRTGGVIVEQVIRPTGLLDPVIEVRPAQGQVDDLVGQIREVIARRVNRDNCRARSSP